MSGATLAGANILAQSALFSVFVFFVFFVFLICFLLNVYRNSLFLWCVETRDLSKNMRLDESFRLVVSRASNSSYLSSFDGGQVWQFFINCHCQTKVDRCVVFDRAAKSLALNGYILVTRHNRFNTHNRHNITQYHAISFNIIISNNNNRFHFFSGGRCRRRLFPSQNACLL